MNAVTAGVLTAELRKRLAETNNTNDDPAASHVLEHGMTLGARALHRARLATALHMAATAMQRTNAGATPVPPTPGSGEIP